MTIMRDKMEMLIAATIKGGMTELPVQHETFSRLLSDGIFSHGRCLFPQPQSMIP